MAKESDPMSATRIPRKTRGKVPRRLTDMTYINLGSESTKLGGDQRAWSRLHTKKNDGSNNNIVGQSSPIKFNHRDDRL